MLSYRQRHGVLAVATCICLIGTVAAIAVDSEPEIAGETVRLFNGRDLEGWYVYTPQTQYANPDVFQAVEGMLFVPGGKDDIAYFGGLITKEAFENYRLRFEYKWGGPTYGARKDKARDSGVLLHCVGPNGPGPWMTSFEFQIIEGGTGDLLLVNTGQGDDAGKKITLKCAAETEHHGDQPQFKEGAALHTYETAGIVRLNWWGRDPDWKDQVDFRGSKDVESPVGEWTRCEIIAQGDTLEFYVNGKLVNRARGLNLTKGKILFQTEGAEVWYRNIELIRLTK